MKRGIFGIRYAAPAGLMISWLCHLGLPPLFGYIAISGLHVNNNTKPIHINHKDNPSEKKKKTLSIPDMAQSHNERASPLVELNTEMAPPLVEPNTVMTTHLNETTSPITSSTTSPERA